MEVLTPHATDFAEKRRILQLETLYDLALALYSDRPEVELMEELLQQVCAVLDPATAAAVTRDAFGGARAVASVGWPGSPPAGDALLSMMLRTANGRLTAAEALGHREFVLTRLYESA